MSETKNIYLFIYFEESGINTQVRDPIFAMTLGYGWAKRFW